jgi:hypothetical protein
MTIGINSKLAKLAVGLSRGERKDVKKRGYVARSKLKIGGGLPGYAPHRPGE